MRKESMTSDEQIREAIEEVKVFTETKVINKPLQEKLLSLIDLAADYLRVAGKMPEEKKHDEFCPETYGLGNRCKCNSAPHNTARRECILAVEKMLDIITPEKLHQLYLDATRKLKPESYNPNAQKYYEDLTDEQQAIDIYIARAIREAVLEKEE